MEKRATYLRDLRMVRRAQGAAHREGARRTRRSNPRAQSRELRVRKNVRSDRESIEVPTRYEEEVSVERGVATYRG